MGNAVISANAGARLVPNENQIKRFARSYRKRIRKLTRQSSRLGDLIYTFPAAAFALASGYATPDRRGATVRLVRDGAPLAAVAKGLDLPLWSRRLPPEAFTEPFGDLPADEHFGRQIVNLVPDEASEAARWLSTLQVSLETCGPDFAIWCARQPALWTGDGKGDLAVRPLALFAWFSGEADVRGRRLIEKPWHGRMGFGAAVEQMSQWFDRVIGDLCRADQKRGPGRYSRRQRGLGYTIMPLRTAHELYEEGEAMQHCVATYAGAVAARECFIYSIRRGGRRIATLELRWIYGRNRGLGINQLQGPGNSPVDPVVWKAVQEWMATHDVTMRASAGEMGRMSLDATRWKAMWLPYVNAKRGKAIVGERPDNMALMRLLRDIEALIRAERGW